MLTSDRNQLESGPAQIAPGRTLSTADKAALVEIGLCRAADLLGDITAPALERFYRRYPEALASFDAHAVGDRMKLEGDMVENTLYCLMTWFVHPGEIEMILLHSVPHHNHTLEVRPEWYGGFIEAVIAVILETGPESAEEAAVWHEICCALRELVERSHAAG
jgi:hypothetical protein